MSRILFYVSAVDYPVGGLNVIFDCVQILKAAGIEAHAFSATDSFEYPFISPAPEIFHVHGLQEDASRRGRIRNLLTSYRARHRNPELEIGPGDVVVVPEFLGAWLPKQLPGATLVLLVQGYRVLVDAVKDPSWNPGAFVGTVTISDVCRATAEMVGLSDIRNIPLSIDADLFRHDSPKRPIIAYMPRRRGEEVHFVTTALRKRGRVEDFELVAIDNLSHSEVAGTLREASIFLSFSQMEGFGLPPAEAMAAGCLVVGYTGVGGAEFLDAVVGFPVLDGDLPRFVKTVEQVADLCRTSPEVVASMRQRASDRIRERYGRTAFVENVKGIFGDFLAKTLNAA